MKDHTAVYQNIDMPALFAELGALHAAQLTREATAIEAKLSNTWDNLIATLAELEDTIAIMSEYDSASEDDE